MLEPFNFLLLGEYIPKGVMGENYYAVVSPAGDYEPTRWSHPGCHQPSIAVTVIATSFEAFGRNARPGYRKNAAL